MALGLCALTAAERAYALGPVDIEVAGKVGYGTDPGVEPDLSNPLGLGFGLRGGASFHGLYGGLSFMDYVGSTENLAGGPSISVHVLQLGREVGYGLTVDRVTIRPLLGAGDYVASEDGHVTDYFYLQPGATVLAAFGRLIVGADASALVLPHVSEYDASCFGVGCSPAPVYKTGLAMAIDAQLGARF